MGNAQADDRMSLFLNNGSQSNPPVVVLLTPSTMNEQLNSACKAFVDHTVKASRITTTAASVGCCFYVIVVTPVCTYMLVAITAGLVSASSFFCETAIRYAVAGTEV